MAESATMPMPVHIPAEKRSDTSSGVGKDSARATALSHLVAGSVASIVAFGSLSVSLFDSAGSGIAVGLLYALGLVYLSLRGTRFLSKSRSR